MITQSTPLQIHRERKRMPVASLLDPAILMPALPEMFRKVDSRLMIKNPVMFVVLIGTVVTLIDSITNPSVFAWSVTVWLALTVLFAVKEPPGTPST